MEPPSLLHKLEHLSVQERAVSPEQTTAATTTTAAEVEVEEGTRNHLISTPARSATPTRGVTAETPTTSSMMMSTKQSYAAPTLAMLARHRHHRNSSPDHPTTTTTIPTTAAAAAAAATRKTTSPATVMTSNSPSTSQVSVGSVGPTLVATAMRQFDLTPVTRNTSQDRNAYADDHHHHHGASKIVSPDQEQRLLQPTTTTTNTSSSSSSSSCQRGRSDDFLHGEHLALPCDLNEPTTTTRPTALATAAASAASAAAAASTAPAVAPLSLPPLQRERSVGTLDQHSLWQHQQQQQQLQHGHNNDDDGDDDDDMKPDVIPGPVQFGERKVATFTSREQYEEELLREQMQLQQQRQQQHHHHHQQYYGMEHETAASRNSPRTSPLRTQYQPTRDDEGVGNLPPEALAQIFIARRGATAAATAEAGGESHHNHRLNTQHIINAATAAPTSATSTANTSHLQQPYPMDDRQGSIPSIHLAHHLHGSTASYTTCDDTLEDEESSLQYYEGAHNNSNNNNNGSGNNNNSNSNFNHNDDWSLSSRSSSLYLPDDAAGTTTAAAAGTAAGTATSTATTLPTQPILALGPSHSRTIVMEELSRVIADAQQKQQNSKLHQDATAAASEAIDDSSSLEAVVDAGGRKRKHEKPHRSNQDRQAAAMSWIESVKGDQNDLAEAASSRFLTGRNHHQTMLQQQPLQQEAQQQQQPQLLHHHHQHHHRPYTTQPPSSSRDVPRAPLLAPRLSNTPHRRQSVPAVFRDAPIIRPAMSEEQETQHPSVSSGTSSPTF